MPNTYSQIYIQIVFAVKGRQCLIPKEHREEIHKYITGIVQKREHKMLSIFCMPDHTHILVGLNPSISVSDLVRDIKAISLKFITENNFVKAKFNWQEGYGAFSYGKSQIKDVILYKENQEKHHSNKSFKIEYLDFLEKFEIEHEEKYLFEWID